jgi:predicted ATPase
MELQLKNIGMIKEANVKIDGLTVIAGENDTGKSTVGKALLFVNEVNYYPKIKKLNIDNLEIYDKLSKEQEIWIDENVRKLFKSIFSFSPRYDTKIDITNKVGHVVFIETPIVTNLFSFFSKLDTMQIDIDYKISNYPYLFRHLYKQLKLELKEDNELHNNIFNKLESIINGTLEINDMGELIFNKKDKTYNINSIATGIKNFGILQLLIKNNYLTKNSILIVDEPEVHLHSKWQLKYAQFIIELIKNGVKVLITSHSPYMIEALQRYSELSKINSDFYIAEDGYIKKVNDSNAETLSKIFEKLSEPFDVFDEMDSQSMEKLING